MNGIQENQTLEFVQSATVPIGTKQQLTHAEYQRIWRSKNKDKVAASKTRYREKNADRIATVRKEWAKQNKEKIDEHRLAWEKNNRQKHLAHKAISWLVSQGKIIKPTECSYCFVKCLPEAHHPDYTKRKEVIFLCHNCHRKIHEREVKP